MIVLGLTGSIGMGKSTTTRLFAEAGAATYDADAAVHALYAPGGGAASALQPWFADAVRADGSVDREALSRALMLQPALLQRLEGIVHPMIASQRAAFLSAARAAGDRVAVLDIPLLFETGGERDVDGVVVVSAPAEVQRARVLARPGMDPEKLELMLARQTPDADKRARADFVIDTGSGLAEAREQVRTVMATVLQPGWKAT